MALYRYEIVLKASQNPNGLIIARTHDFLCIICPECEEGHYSYANSKDRTLNCGSCRAHVSSFPGTTIPETELKHSGRYRQIARLGDGMIEATEWLERWTGLTDVGITFEKRS